MSSKSATNKVKLAGKGYSLSEVNVDVYPRARNSHLQ